MNYESYTRIPALGKDPHDPLALKYFILKELSSLPHDLPANRPYIFDGVVFAVCKEGRNVITVNFKEYTLEENTMLIILPGYIFQIRDYDGFVIDTMGFSYDFLNDIKLPDEIGFFYRIAESPCLHLSQSEMRMVNGYYEAIKEKYYSETFPYRKNVIKSLTYALLLEIGAIYNAKPASQPAENNRTEDLSRRFFDHLLRDFRQERSVEFYADKMCITRKYLSLTIKKVTGYSAGKWIDDLIMAEAKLMLRATDMTVLQVSEALNFSNPSFFGRYFKKHAGITPFKYQNER